MESKSKAILIIALILGVGIPSSYLGVQYFLNNQVNNAEVDVKSLQILDLRETSFDVKAELTIRIDSPIEASFKLKSVTLSNKGTSLGTVSLSNDTFSTSETNLTTILTINVDNQTQYYVIISDFMNSETLNFTFAGTVQFLEKLSVLPEQKIEKAISIGAMKGVNFNVSGLNLISMSQESINVSVSVAFTNPSNISATLPGILIEVTYGTVKIGATVKNNFAVITGTQTQTVFISLNSSGTNFIDAFITNISLSLDVKVRLILGAYDNMKNYPLLLEKNITVKGLSQLPFVLEQFRILNFTSNAIYIKINGAFNNTSEIQAKFQKILVTISYKGQQVGSAELLNMALVPGMNAIELIAQLNATGNSLITDFVSMNEIEFLIKGWVQIEHANTNLVHVFDKNLTISGLSQLPFFLNEFRILNFTNDAIYIEINGEFNNTSNIQAKFRKVLVTIMYKGQQIGIAEAHNMTMMPGMNQIKFTAQLNATDNPLLDDFMTMDEVELVLNGWVQIEREDGDLIQIFVRTIKVPGFDDASLRIYGLHLTGINKDIMNFTIDVEFMNTSPLELALDHLKADLIYDSTIIATTTILNQVMIKGINNFKINISIDCSTTDLMAKFITSIALNFTLNISAKIGDGTYNLTENISILGLNGPQYELRNIALKDAVKDELKLEIAVAFNNPSPIEANFYGIILNITYNGILIGNGTAMNITFAKGLNIIYFEVDINGSKGNFMQDFISQASLNLSIAAFLKIAENTPIQDYLLVINHTETITGLNGPQYLVKNIRLVGTSGNLITAEIDVEFQNPSNINATFAELFLNVTYKGEYVGNGSDLNIQFCMGANVKTFTLTIDSSKANFLNEFVDQDKLKLSINAYLKIIDNIALQDAIHILNVTYELIGMGGIDPIIGDIDLVGATQTQIFVNVTTSFENPTELSVNITNIWAGVFYDGIQIGVATKNIHTLVHGTNILILESVLSGPTAKIEEFLGDYITNKISGFEIRVNFTIKISTDSTGINQNLTFFPVLQGVTQQLVGVTVTQISVNAYPSIGYTVNTQFRIYNPMDFGVQVTAFTGTIKYNDTDGATIPMVVSYGAQNNITLTTASFPSWATTPLELSASGSNTGAYPFTGSNQEQSIRLYDEHVVKNRLKLNIYGAQVTFKIGGFTATVTIDITNIPVN
jgi:LEA14-like dessication related protein